MIKLPILPLTDFSKISKHDKVDIEIFNTMYKFSPDAKYSGENERYHPIFASRVYINNELMYNIPFGLAPLLFPQKSVPLINFINNTKFTTNLHFHGLINTGLIDGASSFAIFGPSTSLGTTVSMQFPPIKNNSALTWYHSHAMFRSIELVCAGMVGTIIITDEITKELNKSFIYGENYFVLTLMDGDFDNEGRQVLSNLAVDINRSCFTVINGISTVQWYEKSDMKVPFSNVLEHITKSNLVKIDIINLGTNWRVYYIGISDNNKNILPFYLIQTDQGLSEPILTTKQFIPVGGRISILVDLTIINEAEIFFYDYDLTENFGINPDGTAIFPDFNQEASTPFPTPIPDPNNTNQESIETTLNYPLVPLIQQVNLPMINGMCPIPTTNYMRKFLHLKKKSSYDQEMLDLDTILKLINDIVYTSKCCHIDKNNYLTKLNSKYYYNLPNPTEMTPIRNICLWGETDINYKNGSYGNLYIVDKNGSNIYGVSECVNGANRIMADLWNSEELDLNYALNEYSKNPNNFKPYKLPTSDFKITKKNDKYINMTMISNDELTIQLFENDIKYGDKKTTPIAKETIIFSPTEQDCDLNLQQWIDLLNFKMKNSTINIKNNLVKMSELLEFDWSFFPYGINLLDGTTKYLKTAIIKTKNDSNYCIRLLGRWALLQMIGKCMVGNKNTVPPTPGACPCSDVNSPCDEEYLYGVYDNLIQTWYPSYATYDEDIQNPILCPRRNAELIIQSKLTYIGFYDGFANDNLRSFSTRLRNTEIWTYLNADTGDSHPLHFHLTSGFIYKKLTQSMQQMQIIPNDVDEITGLTQTFSRDIYQIGPQQSISFALCWPYYSSEDSTITPYMPNIGAVIHCHFLPHNDANSMMISYAVKENDYFCSYNH